MNKHVSFLFLFLLFINSTFALQVSEGTPQQAQQQDGSFMDNMKQVLSEVNWGLIASITMITVGACAVFGFIFWIIWKIYKKINEDRRTKDNTEYIKYLSDVKICKINSDNRYIKKHWWSFWLLKKRAGVYIKTQFGRKFIGYYVGEAVKKEEFFIMAIEQKNSFFARETDVVVMPYKLMRQVYLKNDDFTLDLVCEGIDEVLSSEYYTMPVFVNPDNKKSNKKDFIDFSSHIMDTYFKTYIERDATKEIIKEYRTNIKEATEMNSGLLLDRKSTSQLRE